MYVRKFEADTLEEALKNIKRELGPDAIVLKTITNKGLKGAFKKKKIEITAAISEKNYTEKAKVDSVLDEEQKEKFYQSSSSHVAKQIHGYNQQTNQASKSGYGSMGLNRPVKSTQNNNETLNSSLESFLKEPEPTSVQPIVPQKSFDHFMADAEVEKSIEYSRPAAEPKARIEPVETQSVAPAPEPVIERPPVQVAAPPAEQQISFDKYESVIAEQNHKIENLEARIQELVGVIEHLQANPVATNSVLKELRNKLRALGISEEYIQKLIRKISFDFDGVGEEDFDEILDLTLNEMMGSVKTKMPLFSSSDEEQRATITIFVSDSTCGQSSMAQKIATLCPDSQIVTLGGEADSLATQLLDLNIKHVQNPSEIVTTCRKNNAEGVNTFVDYRSVDCNDNFKKFVKGLRRSFDKVEVFTTISAIHTETYNEKVLNKYEDVSDGVVVNFIDHCLDYGMLFNLNQKFQDTPYIFYGNGDMIPDDVEAATAERLLAGMFRIK